MRCVWIDREEAGWAAGTRLPLAYMESWMCTLLRPGRSVVASDIHTECGEHIRDNGYLAVAGLDPTIIFSREQERDGRGRDTDRQNLSYIADKDTSDNRLTTTSPNVFGDYKSVTRKVRG